MRVINIGGPGTGGAPGPGALVRAVDIEVGDRVRAGESKIHHGGVGQRDCGGVVDVVVGSARVECQRCARADADVGDAAQAAILLNFEGTRQNSRHTGKGVGAAQSKHAGVNLGDTVAVAADNSANG